MTHNEAERIKEMADNIGVHCTIVKFPGVGFAVNICDLQTFNFERAGIELQMRANCVDYLEVA